MHTPRPSKTTPENGLGRGSSGGGGSFVVRRLDSCGLGFFLGHAFGDEGAVGRGGGVSYWVGSKIEKGREGRKGEKGGKAGRETVGRTWK